jgi:dsDNA-binding SOS-regulon protein
MKIKRVASYETTDGQVFTDKKAAQQHQKNVDRKDALIKLINERANNYSANVTRVGDLSDHWMSVDFGEIANFILDNADELRAILPQRAKSEPEPDFMGELIAANAAQGQEGAATVQ